MTETKIAAAPIEGPAYDKAKPETRQPWLDFRGGGITATEIRDWGTASKKRQIIDSKISGVWEDLSDLPYVAHGNVREPVISEWVERKFGISPCESTFARADNPRHMASPDGVSRDPFSGALIYDSPEAILSEIKTSKNDLTPGTLTENRTLIKIARGSKFDTSGYYTQMQWQMHVMGSPLTLFVYEQHNDKIDPETNTFSPIGVPEYAWIPRNQELIDVLIENVATPALAAIDAARIALKGGALPPTSDFPAEDAVLVQDVLRARDSESVAKTSREKAWEVLDKKYPDDCTHDLGFAQFTVSSGTSTAKTSPEEYVDVDGMNAREKQQYERALALIAKHTKTRDVVTPGKPYRKMTITAKKAE